MRSMLQGKNTVLVLSSILLLGVVGGLIYFNYLSLQDLQKTALDQWEQQAEKRALTLNYFFSERFYDLQNIINSREIKQYYHNKALGMSMQYGLRASLGTIENFFKTFITARRVGDETIYKDILLLGPKGDVLVSSSEESEDHLPLEQIFADLDKDRKKPKVRVINCDEHGWQIVFSRPYIYKGSVAGQIIAVVSVSGITNHFLRHQTNSGSGFMLLSLDNKKLINTQGLNSQLIEKLQELKGKNIHS